MSTKIGYSVFVTKAFVRNVGDVVKSGSGFTSRKISFSVDEAIFNYEHQIKTHVDDVDNGYDSLYLQDEMRNLLFNPDRGCWEIDAVISASDYRRMVNGEKKSNVFSDNNKVPGELTVGKTYEIWFRVKKGNPITNEDHTHYGKNYLSCYLLWWQNTDYESDCGKALIELIERNRKLREISN